MTRTGNYDRHSVNIDDIQAAHQRIRHQVLETPLVIKALSALNNGRVFLKCGLTG